MGRSRSEDPDTTCPAAVLSDHTKLAPRARPSFLTTRESRIMNLAKYDNDEAQAPAPALEDMGVCTPEADIASMRHETESTRLFIT